MDRPFQHPLRALLAAVLAFLAVGCARTTLDVVLKDVSEDPDAGAFIADVPFFPQSEYMCGPASLASVMAFYGKDADTRRIAKEVYEDNLRGTLPLDMLIYARDRGFEAMHYRGSIADLKERIRARTPVIIFLNLGYDFYPVWHYVVVVGYDDRRKVVIAHSGMDKGRVFAYNEIQEAWDRTDNSTLLIKPKGVPR